VGTNTAEAAATSPSAPAGGTNGPAAKYGTYRNPYMTLSKARLRKNPKISLEKVSSEKLYSTVCYWIPCLWNEVCVRACGAPGGHTG
jgi:hypothetical protein